MELSLSLNREPFISTWMEWQTYLAERLGKDPPRSMLRQHLDNLKGDPPEAAAQRLRDAMRIGLKAPGQRVEDAADPPPTSTEQQVADRETRQREKEALRGKPLPTRSSRQSRNGEEAAQ